MTLEQQDVQERLIDLRIRVKGLEMIVDALLSERKEPEMPQGDDPRNDDAQAIAALERFISGGSLKAYIIVTTKGGYQVEIVTYPEDDHVSLAENAKLSHAITDAILAAEEKRNEDHR